jgi:hypothetical protein
MQHLWYVPLTLGNVFQTELSELNLIFLQSYASVSSSSNFHREDDILRFDLRVPIHAQRLARRSHILDEFGDFNDYELDNSVDFLMNSAVQDALNSPE